MLQINSGKLFTRGIEHRNRLRGVLYTNLKFGREDVIETAAGALLPTSTLKNSLALVYELTEQIEEQPSGRGVLVSHGIDPYLQDFSAVVAFALHATCTPSYELARRLTSSERGLSTHYAPQRLVKRVFDEQVWCQQHEIEKLVVFTKQLIGLERKSFLGVMRAMRTYVTGMYRIADDLELAYTLLVASIESLAQAFDGHRATWFDYEERKRHAIDKALAGADVDLAERVRAALLEIEHTSLARRFRDFAISHIKPTYFRQEAATADGPVSHSDLPSVLTQAYRARSLYIHNLQELPRVLTLGHSFNETVRVDRTTWLTLQGLARLARHVILEFVERQTSLEKEPYDYQCERAGIVQLPMAPQYWVGRADGITAQEGRVRLEGFLEQLTDHVLGVPNATVTDLRAALEKVEVLLPSMTLEQRRPFIALHLMFNQLAPVESKLTSAKKIMKKYAHELETLSSESLVVQIVTGLPIAWDISEHAKALQKYFRQRDKNNGLRVTRVIEAAMTLTLAERYRQIGDLTKTRALIASVVENFPGHEGLQKFEEAYVDLTPIDWRPLLLPSVP